MDSPFLFFLQCSTPTTPSYSQSLELENRMLDGSTIPAAAHASAMQTTVISSGPNVDCRHVVCQPSGRQFQIQTTSVASISLPGSSFKATRTKPRARTEDPCQLAPLKKRKIQVGHVTECANTRTYLTTLHLCEIYIYIDYI